jgi:hypothetical protein
LNKTELVLFEMIFAKTKTFNDLYNVSIIS